MASTSISRLALGSARQIADAVTAVRGVAGLHPGRFGDAVFRADGGMVEGLKYRPEDDALEVHVIYKARSKRPLEEVAAEIRVKVASISKRAKVDVIFAEAR